MEPKDLDLRLLTNPFLREMEKRDYWIDIERRIQEQYNSPSLPEFVENKQSCGKSLTEIARELDVNPNSFYYLLRRIGYVPLMFEKKGRKRIAIENRIKEEYNMSLSDFLYKRYCTDEFSLRDLGKELGMSSQMILIWMREFKIRTRNSPG